MEPRRAVRAMILAPKRFLDWVYAPDGPRRPTRGQTMVHLHMASAGHDTSRWLQIEEDERRAREAAVRRVGGSPSRDQGA